MKITIIGTGVVGTVLAYTLMLRGAASEILLIDKNHPKANAEATDLMHAQAFLQVPVHVRAGEIADATGSEVVVICASVPASKEFHDRNELALGNAALMRGILPDIARAAPDCKLLMVSNPVDALTWQAIQLTGFAPERVMGTGTLVDSLRLREMLSHSVDIHPDDLRAYILGEHGSHQFAALSVANAGGEKIDDTPERHAMCEKATNIGIEVFRNKGNTCFAIAQAASYIIESIIYNERRTIPLSAKIDGYLGVENVCLSVPVVVGRSGIERYLHPSLNEQEIAAFRRAAHAVREVIDVIS